MIQLRDRDGHSGRATTGRTTPRAEIMKGKGRLGLCCVALQRSQRDQDLMHSAISVLFHITQMSSTPGDGQGASTAKKTTSSVEDTVVRKAPFGSRCVFVRFVEVHYDLIYGLGS